MRRHTEIPERQVTSYGAVGYDLLRVPWIGYCLLPLRSGDILPGNKRVKLRRHGGRRTRKQEVSDQSDI